MIWVGMLGQMQTTHQIKKMIDICLVYRSCMLGYTITPDQADAWFTSTHDHS